MSSLDRSHKPSFPANYSSSQPGQQPLSDDLDWQVDGINTAGGGRGNYMSTYTHIHITRIGYYGVMAIRCKLKLILKSWPMSACKKNPVSLGLDVGFEKEIRVGKVSQKTTGHTLMVANVAKILVNEKLPRYIKIWPSSTKKCDS